MKTTHKHIHTSCTINEDDSLIESSTNNRWSHWVDRKWELSIACVCLCVFCFVDHTAAPGIGSSDDDVVGGVRRKRRRPPKQTTKSMNAFGETLQFRFNTAWLTTSTVSSVRTVCRLAKSEWVNNNNNRKKTNSEKCRRRTWNRPKNRFRIFNTILIQCPFVVVYASSRSMRVSEWPKNERKQMKLNNNNKRRSRKKYQNKSIESASIGCVDV